MDRQGEFQDSKNGMMLCLYCEMLVQEPGLGHGGSHHRNSSSLLESVESGCPICIRFYNLVRKSLGDEVTNNGFKEASYHVSVKSSASDSFQVCLEFDNGRLSYSVIPMSGRNHVIRRDISSTTTFFDQDWSLVEKWIAECDSMHRNCSQLYKGSHILPSRLLLADERSLTVRLVYRDDLHTGLKYVALSYCWGDGKIFKLTKSSQAALNSGISIMQLPKTYRDAIVVARQLKVQYIWIDALCIFQDSLEDWQKESSNMHNIYRNAFCCLAATGATNPDDGLFRVRDPMLINTFIGRTKDSKDFLFFNSSDWEDGITNSPLGKRGWALQERLLSRRILHFGEQLYWECGQLDANEIFPAGINTIRDAFLGHTRFKGLDPFEDGEYLRLENGERHPEWNVYRLWNRILETYSGCSLTMKEDKLIALSGIAKHIMLNLGGDAYLAGLWHRVLPFQLLWGIVYNKSHPTKSNPYRAPSWSWASLDGQIWFESFHGDPLITIIDAAVTPFGKDSTGQISDAYIRLDGELLMIPTNHKTGKEGLGGSYERCQLDTLKRRHLALEAEYFFYLPVLEREWSIVGLVLLGMSVRGRYTRIGRFSLERHDSDLEYSENPAGFLEEARKSCYPSSPLWFEEGTQRTICLV